MHNLSVPQSALGVRRALIAIAAVFAGFATTLALAPSTARAQMGATTDIITGTVIRAETNAPLEGANIEVMSIETNVTRRARTNAQGKFTVLFPDGGGQYRVIARSLGLAPATVTVARHADEDRLVVNIKLTTNPTVLAAVTVQARQNVPREGDRPAPGSVERALNADQAARLPIDASDLTQLALTAPGVVSITGSDTSGAGFSVAGQAPTANNITLDGLSFGSSQVPQEAVRNSRVITSGYDVARGQFSGGQIASTTRSGTNTPQGNFTYSLRDRSLAVEGEDSSPLSQGYTQNQFSGGFGSHVIKDKLFYFTALQLRRREDIVPNLGNADAATLERFGVAPDSVARFFSLAQAAGISPRGILANDRTGDNLSGILRVDYLTEGGQSLSIRGDYSYSNSDPTRISTLSLPQTGGDTRNWGGGLAATLTSNIGGRFLNELKLYGSVNKNAGEPFLTLPFGRVQVSSELDNGETGISTLTFGGNTGLPQAGRTNAFEATNETSWLSEGGAHRFKLGGLFNLQSFERDVTSNRWGTFTFNSLADFEAGRAAMYTRTLTPRLREGAGANAAVYLGDTWRVNRALQLTMGARAEGSYFGRTPAYNPVVEQAFGFRTDKVPTEFRLSPRAGFTYSLGMPEQGRFAPPTWVLRGGVGEFRSSPSIGLVASAAGATGLPDNESQLVCIGSGVPIPNWNLYAQDPASSPTSCLDGGNQVLPTTSPNVTVFDNDFSAARSVRSSFGVQHRFRQRYNINLDFQYARGVALTGYTDVNLRSTPQFGLAGEGGRPVFVDASTIVPVTGAVSVLGSRNNGAFGQVLATGSDLSSDSKQVTLSMGGITSQGAVLNFSYTWAQTIDQGATGMGGGGAFGGFGGGGGSFGSPTTAGNPNIREWAPSDFDRRHTIVGTVTYPFSQALEVTAFGRLSSGSPFTPMVGADINGDGSRNDRAFLFNPATTSDVAVAEGIQHLLDNAPDAVKSCLESQLGGIAGRNSCRGPWQPSLDLQLNWRPNFMGLNRRLAISVMTVNALGGLDQLLHGDNLRGWGQFRGTDNTLLYVRGFDASTQSYKYQVNERFGANRAGQNGIKVPFQLGIQARYTVGPDRFRDMIRGMIGGQGGAGGQGQRGPGGFGGPGGPGGQGGGPGGFGGGFGMGGANANPVQQVLALKDSIALTAEQVTKLQPLSDSLAARNKVLGDEFQKMLKDAGANPDMGALFGKIRPKMEAAQKDRAAALKEVQAILTPEQWEKVPERVRNPQFGPGGQGQRRPPGGER
ncbi:MAG: carboxypeptidase regulatory-like domain-containing protein [Gemmatimonadaceae bacterium]|nr:carboxypeptidase regulatory-like domain-containing protein [Gemmatimonadaceae bacterium]